MLFAECDPSCAQACYEGVQVETVMSEIDIFVTPTAIITFDHMKKLKNKTFIGNTGHCCNEVDLAGSEGFEGTEVDHIKLQKIVIVSPVGHSVIMMRRLKGFFHTFHLFFFLKKKSAESGRQCGEGGNFRAERSSNGSCRSRRALQLMDAGGV